MKLNQTLKQKFIPLVAPCAGAWVEITAADRFALGNIRSPPVRGRGLKCGI